MTEIVKPDAQKQLGTVTTLQVINLAIVGFLIFTAVSEFVLFLLTMADPFFLNSDQPTAAMLADKAAIAELSSRSATNAVYCAILMVLLLVMFILNVKTLLANKKQRDYRLCVITSYLELLLFPIGTAIGAYSLWIYSRPAVKSLFEPASEAI